MPTQQVIDTSKFSMAPHYLAQGVVRLNFKSLCINFIKSKFVDVISFSLDVFDEYQLIFLVVKYQIEFAIWINCIMIFATGIPLSTYTNVNFYLIIVQYQIFKSQMMSAILFLNFQLAHLFGHMSTHMYVCIYMWEFELCILVF